MFRVIGAVVLLSVMWTCFSVSAACTAVCDPEVSRPCGMVCISKWKNCHKPTTSACMGKAGRSTKKNYDNPTKVEPEEQKKNNETNDGADIRRWVDHARKVAS